MFLSNIDYAIVYVDPSIATAGNGSTPATALKNLPTPAALANNTCYLIRRTAESAYCSIASGSAGSAVNLLLWGMPKATDEEYEMLPAAAKTAWGADVSEYANILASSPSSAVEFPAAKNFSLLRCYLFRAANVSPSAWIFNFGSTSKESSIRFAKSKFGVQGIDIEQDSYTIGVTTSAMKQYVKTAGSRVFALEDCIVNHSLSSYGPGSAYAFQIGASDYVAVSDVSIYSTTQNYSSGYAIYLDDNSGSGRVAMDRLSAAILLNGTGQTLPAILRCGPYCVTTAQGITVTMPRVMAGAAPTALQISQPIFAFATVGNFALDGFNATLDRCWRVLTGGGVLKIDGSHFAVGVAQSRTVRDVTVQMAEADGIGGGSDIAWVAGTCEYSAVAVDFSGSYMGGPSGGGALARMDVAGISVNHPRGIAFYGNGIQLSSAAFKGAVKLKGAAAVLSTIESWYPANAVIADNYTTATVQQITVNTANADYPYSGQTVVFSTDKLCMVYVDSCNVALQPNAASTAATVSNQYAVICGNEGAAGHFSQRTANCLAETWTVYRQGGAAASMKLYNNAVSAATAMQMGQYPFAGIRVTPTATGKHLLKIHVATKMPDLAELGQRFVAIATVPATNGSQLYFSNVHGQIANDASAWLNDEGLTAKVITIPLLVTKTGAEGAIDVKLDFNWYNPTGFLYVDPAFELVKI